MGQTSSAVNKGVGTFSRRRLPTPQTEFTPIPDQYESIEEVTKALRDAGLEASQLIVGVDFTKSNTWTGANSFEGRCLHSVEGPPNPYLIAMSLISRTLESFDDDKLIPCYGFGDVTTRGDAIFSFFSQNQPCNGLEHMLHRYRQIAPYVDLSGPTSFAPLIREAMRHVYDNDMEFHLLLIVADGQISVPCLDETKAAIVDASHFPISIVVVGVGDGPWDLMMDFDDGLPQRQFDNFQFVNFNGIMDSHAHFSEQRKQASFALNALMELPEQYKLVRNRIGRSAKDRVTNIVRTIPGNLIIDPPIGTEGDLFI